MKKTKTNIVYKMQVMENLLVLLGIIPARVNYQQKFPFLEFCVTENFIFREKQNFLFWVCVTSPTNGSWVIQLNDLFILVV